MSNVSRGFRDGMPKILSFLRYSILDFLYNASNKKTTPGTIGFNWQQHTDFLFLYLMQMTLHKFCSKLWRTILTNNHYITRITKLFKNNNFFAFRMSCTASSQILSTWRGDIVASGIGLSYIGWPAGTTTLHVCHNQLQYIPPVMHNESANQEIQLPSSCLLILSVIP